MISICSAAASNWLLCHGAIPQCTLPIFTASYIGFHQYISTLPESSTLINTRPHAFIHTLFSRVTYTFYSPFSLYVCHILPCNSCAARPTDSRPMPTYPPHCHPILRCLSTVVFPAVYTLPLCLIASTDYPFNVVYLFASASVFHI